MLIALLKRLFAVAMLSCIATFAFADDAAPVYDADNFPPQFDGQVDNDVVQPHAVPAPAQVQSYNAPSQPLSNDQRLSRAEQQINQLQHSNDSSKVDTLKGEVQSLRGQVEELTHQLQQLQTQQRSQYSDLDKRLSKQPTVAANKPKAVEPVDTTTDVDSVDSTMKSTPDDVIPAPKAPATKVANKASKTPAVKTEAPAATVAADKSVEPQPNVAEEQQIYQTAYNLIKAKKYNEAVAALQKMLQKYPTGQFAANAHYWLGELYGLMGNNDQSALEFSTVVKNYPDSPKVSDAQLKLGLIYSAQFKWPDAKTAFKKVVNRYPGTASARLAAEQLKQLKEAGH
jgi:tol-pal system protein YbgF